MQLRPQALGGPAPIATGKAIENGPNDKEGPLTLTQTGACDGPGPNSFTSSVDVNAFAFDVTCVQCRQGCMCKIKGRFYLH